MNAQNGFRLVLCARGHKYTAANRRARCPVCESARESARYADDPHRQALTNYAWHKARAAARKRDGNRCRLERQGECYGALQVHHIVSVRRGGDPYDLSNLLTVCRHHHELLEREARKRCVEQAIF